MPEFAALSEPSPRLLDGASLFMDLDGTLIELADSPRSVVVGPHVREMLARAADRLDGRVAVISGRAADDISTLLPGLPILIGGSHGAELRWPDGRRNDPLRAPALDEALRAMRDLADHHPGLLVEDKPFGVALHYRLAPELEEQCRTLALRLSRETGLPLQSGKMVQELKSGATSKGDAVAAFMGAAPMTGGTPLFLGDDDNDEPGFAAATRLGGAGILVGPPRSTAAQWRLASVVDTHNWLRNGLMVRA